jgi:uncharacterized membrane protein YfcA
MIEPGQLAIVLAAVIIGFFAKGLTGIGGPVVSIPVLAAFTGLEHAAAVIAVPGLVANLVLIWRYRALAPEMRRVLVPLIGIGSIGAAAGSWLLVRVDDRYLSGLLGVLLLVYVARQLMPRPLTISEGMAIRLTYPIGAVGGALHGATGISAPAFATYMHAIRVGRERFIFSVSSIFGLLGAVQIVAIAVFGGYDAERVTSGFLAVIPMAVGLPLGTMAGRRISPGTFDKAVLTLLAVTAVRLLWTALGG